MCYASMLALFGRLEESYSQFQHLKQIDPFNPTSKASYGYYTFLSGKFQETIEPFRTYYDLDNSSRLGRFFYSYALAAANNRKQAIALINWDEPDNFLDALGIFFKYSIPTY